MRRVDRPPGGRQDADLQRDVGTKPQPGTGTGPVPDGSWRHSACRSRSAGAGPRRGRLLAQPPGSPRAPSQFDTDHAWVDYVYIICATTREGTGDVNAFTLSDEGGAFVPLLLIVTPREPTPAP